VDRAQRKRSHKAGQLQVNSNLEAKVRTPTTYKAFDIFVTAEDNLPQQFLSLDSVIELMTA
jgi:hypothetical protein